MSVGLLVASFEHFDSTQPAATTRLKGLGEYYMREMGRMTTRDKMHVW